MNVIRGVVLGVAVVAMASGCPTSRTDGRSSISGKVALVQEGGLSDMSRVKVNLGRGEGDVTPGDDGQFEFSDIEPDTYELTITYVGGLTPTATRSAYRRFTRRVVARAGSGVELGVISPVLATGTITGTVSLPPGDSGTAEGIPVEVKTRRGETFSVLTTTGGSFTVLEVPVGNHTISAQVPGSAVGRGQQSCSPSVTVEEEDAMVTAPSLVAAQTRASLVPATGDFVDVTGSSWTVADGLSTVHVNALAAFARKQRAWPAGAESPAFTDTPNGDNPAFELTGITEGRTTYNFQFSDGCGYESPIYTADIIRDETAPVIASALLNGGAPTSRSRSVLLSVIATDALSPTLRMAHTTCAFTNGSCACSPDIGAATVVPYEPSRTVTFSADGDFCVQVQVRDRADNVSTVAEARVLVDSTAPPTPSVRIGAGGTPNVITTPLVGVHVDATGDPAMMRVSETDVGGAAWVGFQEDFTWSFSTAEGTKTLYVQTRDAAGLESGTGAGSATLVTTGNVTGRVVMPDGSAPTGATVSTLDGASSFTVGADGSFDLRVQAGPRILLFEAPVPAMGLPLRVGSRTEQVEVTAAATSALGDITLPYLKGQLVGRVLLAGQPVSSGNAGTTVLITSSPGGIPQPPATTLPDGSWVSGDLVVGAYRVSIQKDQYASRDLGVHDVFGETQTTVPAVTLDRIRGFSINDGATHTNDPTVQVRVFADTGTQLLVSEDPTFTGVTEQAFTSGTPFDFALSTGDGLKTVYVRVVGDPNGDRSAQIIMDTTKPVGADAVLSLAGGADFSRVDTVTAELTLSIDDPNIEFVRLSTDGTNFGPDTRLEDFRSATLLPAVADDEHGQRTLHVKLVDYAGNVSDDAAVDSIYVDRADPLFGSITVVGSTAGNVVRDLTVLLDVDASDACGNGYPLPCAAAASAPTRIMLSARSDFAGASWRDFGTTSPSTQVWYLAPLTTAQTVHVRISDGAGNTASTSLAITLDQQPPTNARVVLPALTSSTTVSAQPRAGDAVEYRVGRSVEALLAASWKTYSDTVTEDVTLDDVEGQATVYAEFRDAAGNIARGEGRTILDTTAPQIALVTVVETSATRLTGNTGALTRDVSVLLRTVATDANGVVDLFIRDGDNLFAPTDRRDYTAAPVAVPLATDGTHTFYVRVVDAAGNTSDPTFVVVRDTTPPVPPSSATLTPRSGMLPARALHAPMPTATDYDQTNDPFPLFAWNGASADTARIVVEAARGSTFATAPLTQQPDVQAVGTGTTGSVNLAGVLEDGVWSWRVVAEDTAGNRAALAGWAFKVDSQGPSEPVITFVPRGTGTTALEFSSTVDVDVLVTSTEGSTTGYTLWMDGEFTQAVYQQAYSSTRIPVTLTSGNGPKTVRAQFIDGAGNRSPVTSRTVVVTLDTLAPTITSTSIPLTSGWSNTATIPVTVLCSDQQTASGQLLMRITDEDGDTLYNGLYAQTVSVTVDARTGTDTASRSVTVRCEDETGLFSTDTETFKLDTTAPSISAFTLNGGAANEATRDRVVGLNYTLADAGGTEASGIGGVAVAQGTFACATASYAPAASVTSLSVTGTDGSKSVYLCARDVAGNFSGTNATKATNDVVLDTAAPLAPGFTLAGGSAFTRNTSVAVAVSHSESSTTGLKVRFSGDITAVADVAWSASLANLALTSTQGLKNVTAQLVDAAGNVSSPVSASVTLDTTAPTISGLTVAGGSPYVTSSDGSTTVQVSCVDVAPSSQLTMVITSNGSNVYSGAYTSSTTIVLGSAAGARSISATCTDPATNAATIATPVTVTVDNGVPTISGFSVNGGVVNEAAGSRNLRVNYTASDGTGTGIAGVALSDSTFACANGAYTFPPTGPQTFPVASDGTKTIYVCAKDRAGNYSGTNATASNAVVVDTVAPSPPTFTIAGAVYRSSSTSTLTTALTTSESSTTGLQVIFTGDITTSGTAVGFQSAPTITITSGDGTKVISARLRDAAGNESSPVTRSVVLDTVAPQMVSLVAGSNGYVNDDAGATSSLVECTDETVPDGLIDLELAVASSPFSTFTTLYDFLPYLREVDVTLGATETTRRIRARCRDAAGNTATAITYDVIVDHTDPVISGFTLGSGATNEPTRSLVQDVNYTITDNNQASLAVALSDTAITSCANATYQYPRTGPATLVLSAGDGQRYAYLCARDAAGNYSGAASTQSGNAVMLDTQADNAGTLSLKGGAAATNDNVVPLTITGRPSGSCVCLDGPIAEAGRCYGVSTTVCDVATVPTSVNMQGGDGDKVVFAYFRDAAGNQSNVFFDAISVDTVAPAQGRIILGGGASEVNSLSLAVSIVGTFGADTMRVWDAADTGGSCGPTTIGGTAVTTCGLPSYEPFSASTVLALTGPKGTKKICWHLCDAAGNGSTQLDDADADVDSNENLAFITLGTYLDRPQPVLSAITPTSYTAMSGANTCGVAGASGPYCFRVQGSGIAADTKVIIGDFEVPCEGADLDDDCVNGSPGSCDTQCVVAALPDAIMERGGTYAVTLYTPSPVDNDLNTSTAVQFLTVRAPVPVMRSLKVAGPFYSGACPSSADEPLVHSRGVRQKVSNGAPLSETYCVKACVDAMMDNALFDLGGNVGDVQAVSTSPSVTDCPVGGDRLVTVAVSTSDLLPNPDDLAFTVGNPNGGEDSLPFGVNPDALDCTINALCKSDLRWTRVGSGDGRSLLQGFRLVGQDLFGSYAWSGGAAAGVRTSTALIARVIAGAGPVPMPFISQPIGLLMEDRSGTGAVVALKRAQGRARRAFGSESVASTDYTTAFANLSPGRVTVGDLNSDGLMDVAVVNTGYDTVSVYRVDLGSGGARSLTPTVELAVGAGVSDVALADFDMDGRQDLVTANEISKTISLYRGKGDGSFTIGSEYPMFAGSSPPTPLGCTRLAVADLNRDGTPDVVCANKDQLTLAVRLGNGQGAFSSPSPTMLTFPGSDFPATVTFRSVRHVAAGDVNGDAIPDLVTLQDVANNSDSTPYAPRSVALWTGNGTGGFSGPTYLAGCSTCGSSAIPKVPLLADFTADGALDLLVVNERGFSMFYRGNGRGSFTGVMQAATELAGQDATFGDVTGDGYLDVVLTTGSAGYALLYNPGASSPDAAFTAPLNFSGRRSYGIALGDLDLDGAPDAVESNDDSQTPTVQIQWGLRTTPSLNPGASLPTVPTSPRNVSLADFNRDGFVDAVTSSNNTTGILNVQYHNTNQVFDDADTSTAGCGTSCANQSRRSVATATFDHNWDGIPDIVFASDQVGAAGNTLGIFNIDANGGLTAKTDVTIRSSTSCANPTATMVLAGDVDNDRAPDLIIPMRGEDVIVVKRMTAASTFATEVVTAAGAGASSCDTGPVHASIGDVNNDGRLDIAMAMVDGSVVVQRQAGAAGAFETTPLLTLSGESADTVYLVDLDADGALDLVWSDAGPPGTVRARRNISGAFSGSTVTLPGEGAKGVSPLVFVDLNGDDAPEMVRVHEDTSRGDIALGDTAVFTTPNYIVPYNWRVPDRPSFLAGADVDHDFYPDLVVTSGGDSVLAVQPVPNFGPHVLELTDPMMKTYDPASPSGDRRVDPGATQNFQLPSGAIFVDHLAVRLRITGATAALNATTASLLNPRGVEELLDNGTTSGIPAGCISQGFTDGNTVWQGHYSRGAGCSRFTSFPEYNPAGSWVLKVTNAGSTPITVADHALIIGGRQRRLAIGSDPARPVMLPRNTKLFSSSTIGRPDGTDIGCTVSTPTRNTGGPLGPGETYHQFTAAVSGTFTATVTAEFDSVVALRNGACTSPGTVAACSDNGASPTGTKNGNLSVSVTAGSTYCLIVDGRFVSGTPDRIHAGAYQLRTVVP